MISLHCLCRSSTKNLKCLSDPSGVKRRIISKIHQANTWTFIYIKQSVQTSSWPAGHQLAWPDKNYSRGTSASASGVICIPPVGNAGTSFISLGSTTISFILLDDFKQNLGHFSRWCSYSEIKSVLYVVMKIVASALRTGITLILSCNLCCWTPNYPTTIPPIT